MLVIVLGTLVYAAFAFAAVHPIFRSANRMARFRNWPRFDGVVTAHDLREEPGGIRIRYRVRYQTSTGAEDTTCEEPFLPLATGFRQTSARTQAERHAGRRPPGAAAQVMVNPADPAELYMVVREYPLKAFGIAVCIILLTLYVMLLASCPIRPS